MTTKRTTAFQMNFQRRADMGLIYWPWLGWYFWWHGV